MEINRKISYPLILKWFSIVVFLAISFSIIAQENRIAFEKYGVAEGLPEEYVGSVIQDDQGFIWCTTQNGLVKYDGYEFQTYSYMPDDMSSTSLKIRNLIGGIIKDNDGNLWMGGYNRGIASFDPKTELFKNYFYNPNDPKGIPFEFSVMLFMDLSENVWFQSTSEEQDTSVLCRIDPKTKIIHRYPFHEESIFLAQELKTQILEFQTDTSIWLLDKNGNLRKFNKAQDAFEVIIQNESILPGTSIVDSLISISNGGNVLYLTGKQGLYLWDPIKKEVIQNFISDHKDINSIFETEDGYAFKDAKGRIWIIQLDGKISIINASGNEITRLQYGIAPLDFGAISEDNFLVHTFQNQEGIWFQLMSNNKPTSFFYYQFATNSFTNYNSRFNYELNQIPIPAYSYYYKFFEDQSGLLWLNTRPNLYKQSPKSLQMDFFQKKEEDPFSLPSDTITYLFEDSRSTIWIGTINGLARYSHEEQKFITYKHNPANPGSVSDNRIRFIFNDSDDKIWIATRNGLNIWDETTSSFKRLFYQSGETNDFASQLLEDDQGNIWISIRDKGVFVLDKKSGKILDKFLPTEEEIHGLTSTLITTMYQDSKSNIWLGERRNDENGLFRLIESYDHFKHYNFNQNDTNSISSNEIMFLVEDEQNRLWIGTDGGLNQFNYEKDRFIRYPEKYLPSIPGYGIGPAGEVWVSTYSGNGLVNVNPETGEIIVFGENEGLAHNDGSQIREKFAVDSFGKFWIPNQRGLSTFDPATKIFTNYTTDDGFQNYCRNYSAIRTADGDIWIGGLHGLNRITPKVLLQKDSTQPEVWITALSVLEEKYTIPDGEIFKKAVSFTEEINLSYEQKDLTFEFVGLHYLRSEDNLYSWKLENYDKAWSAPSKERKAIYTNLPPGSYTFHVKASNADRIWNEKGARIKINIAPPWWQTNLAYIIYGLLFIACVIIVDRAQRKRLKDKQRAKTREKELAQAKAIEKAYTKLKSTQAKLIHSEKMASLGELTAGIAHEIQNPLNFVNNFSEVNAELISELNEEIDKGDLDEAKAIAKDIAGNEKKIIHHGKRADSIVKGMLQHSRTASNEKEPTDINALADEFLRLSYHGLRAKDKSFNADFKTDLDEALPKVNVIPQDIGRALLNLINNAFYACAERSRGAVSSKALVSVENDYKPSVSVSTKNENEKVKITVKDNGEGIPPEVIDKIFQPFFTTKSAGEGTGLGLSLSYDIITKGHGGELIVETKKGEGTEFIILLPK